ncbi:MAG: tRNA (N(6)-L-threonylcarbamoyladenosine(37)-C(2))-methylthiotransferase MtaB [Bacteroidota bacterium]
MKKVAFHTLGCKLNFSETSTIARSFQERGFERVDFNEDPDIFIINTCSVTDNADKKCRKVIREAREVSPNAFVAIIGCYAQLKPQELAEIEGVDAVLGAAEKFKLFDLIGDFERKEHACVYASDIADINEFNPSYSISDRTRTFLKIQDGCDYSCTFCTIPLARGASRSDTIEHVVLEATDLGKKGVREVVLTGINTGDFGIRNGNREDSFFDLVKELDKVKTIERFRISSIEPNLLTKEIIDFVAQSNRFMPHFHVPLQSGSDNVLKAMKRRYSKDLYEDRIQYIRKTIPHASIGVDVIIGFPGESEEEFLKTYQFLNELPCSYLHVFTYSERPNTEAIKMQSVVPQSERNKRSKMLRSLSEKKKRAFYEQNIGSTAKVLYENDVENGKMHGFTENYIRVSAPHKPENVNSIIKVAITAINNNGYAEVAEY